MSPTQAGVRPAFAVSGAKSASLSRRRRSPTTWCSTDIRLRRLAHTFLTRQVKDVVSADFFVVPTARFGLLFVFVILGHDRRRPVHFAVTAHPTAEWTAQQFLASKKHSARPAHRGRTPMRSG